MILETKLEKVQDPEEYDDELSWDSARRVLEAQQIGENVLSEIGDSIEMLIDHRQIMSSRDAAEEKYRQVREVLLDDLRACEAYVNDPSSAGMLEGVPAAEADGDDFIFRGEADDAEGLPVSAEAARHPYWRAIRLANCGILMHTPYY